MKEAIQKERLSSKASKHSSLPKQGLQTSYTLEAERHTNLNQDQVEQLPKCIQALPRVECALNLQTATTSANTHNICKNSQHLQISQYLQAVTTSTVTTSQTLTTSANSHNICKKSHHLQTSQ